MCIYIVYTSRDIIYTVSTYIHVEWSLFNVNVTDITALLRWTIISRFPGKSRNQTSPLLNIPMTAPRLHSPSPPLSPAPCSEPYLFSRANGKETLSYSNAMIDIPCWFGQEIGDFPYALSRKLLAQLSRMGQNSLRHGNNFLDATGCSLRRG